MQKRSTGHVVHAMIGSRAGGSAIPTHWIPTQWPADLPADLPADSSSFSHSSARSRLLKLCHTLLDTLHHALYGAIYRAPTHTQYLRIASKFTITPYTLGVLAHERAYCDATMFGHYPGFVFLAKQHLTSRFPSKSTFSDTAALKTRTGCRPAAK